MIPYYKDHRITIYHGNCLEILPQLNIMAQCVVTSPPYNLVREWSGGGQSACKPMRRLESKLKAWYPDALPEKVYQEQQKQLIALLLERCEGSIFYNHKIRYALKRRGVIYHPLDWLREFPIYAEIIWDRGGATGGGNRRFLQSDERIYMIGKPHTWHKNKFTTVWRLTPEKEVNDHPCPFPYLLPVRAIHSTTDPGDLILDPYCGRGTTLRAAKDLGRRAIGIEKEEKFCEAAVRLLAQECLSFENGPVRARVE